MTNKEIIRCGNSLLTCAVFETIYKNFDSIKILGWTNKNTPLEFINENRTEIFSIFDKLMNANKDNKSNIPDEMLRIASKKLMLSKTRTAIAKQLVESFHINISHFCELDRYIPLDENFSIFCDSGIGAYITINSREQYLYCEYTDREIFNQIKNKYKESESE